MRPSRTTRLPSTAPGPDDRVEAAVTQNEVGAVLAGGWSGLEDGNGEDREEDRDKQGIYRLHGGWPFRRAILPRDGCNPQATCHTPLARALREWTADARKALRVLSGRLPLVNCRRGR